MLKYGLSILVYFAFSTQAVLAERISCINYLMNYAGRTQSPSVERLEPWLSRLRDVGLAELADLVSQRKIMLREADKEGGEPIEWRTTFLRNTESRGYMLILRGQSIASDPQSFWKFANALYEIYFFRSLWGLPRDFWDKTEFTSKYFLSHAPAYFESLHRLTPRMYALYQTLSGAERATLPKRQVSEPNALGLAFQYGPPDVDNRLNQRDWLTFFLKGEEKLLVVLKNHLEPRVIVGHYTGYVRKALLVVTVYVAVMSAYELPHDLHAMQVTGGSIVQSAKSLVWKSKDINERYIDHLRVTYERLVLRRDELKSLTNLAPELQEELKRIEDEIQAILEDNPELKDK